MPDKEYIVETPYVAYDPDVVEYLNKNPHPGYVLISAFKDYTGMKWHFVWRRENTSTCSSCGKVGGTE